jgi:fucose 4-O-acetylase-like acetyltransferase
MVGESSAIAAAIPRVELRGGARRPGQCLIPGRTSAHNVLQEARTMSTSTRTDWVDYAKAIGIILVVYGHVARGLFKAGIEMPLDLYHLADSVVYSFHMPLFFFLSGLFFFHSFSKSGGVGLTLNKVDTIVYPYLIWSILQGGAEALLSNYTNGDVSFSEVLSVWNPRAQFWFLYALFLVFVVSSTMYHFVSEKYVIFVFIISSLLYVNGARLPDMKLITFVAGNLVFFVFGIMFMKYNLREIFSSNRALLVTAVSFAVFQFVFHGYLGKTYADKGVASLFLACVSVLFVVSVSIALARNPNRFLAYIGASSMAIYLMHILAGSGARVVLNKILGVNAAALHLTIGCVAGVLLPLLALKLINALRIPYVFSAPISQWLEFSYDKALLLTNRLMRR